jgi:sulfate transport system substrate-binding protein
MISFESRSTNLDFWTSMNRIYRVAPATAGLIVAAALAGCGGSSDTNASSTPKATPGSGGAQLALVAYSTPKPAYAALTAAFDQTAAGRGVSFTQSFGASGAQSRAVDTGQPADIVAFATTPDITRLVKAGIVAKTWDANANGGIVADSVVVLVTRKGNPKHITGWDDLIKPGIDVITPNPSTSGSARWNILAAYGGELKEGKSPAQALAYLTTLITKHVSVQDASGSDATQTFAAGKGDVLIGYESEAIAAQKQGIALSYVIPKQTILIQTPIAVTAKSSHATAAAAFVSWLQTPQAQAIWAQNGYRPVNKTILAQYASQYPTPAQLFTVGSLGGWAAVTKKFFAPSTGLVTRIEQAAGVPTATS